MMNDVTNLNFAFFTRHTHTVELTLRNESIQAKDILAELLPIAF